MKGQAVSRVSSHDDHCLCIGCITRDRRRIRLLTWIVAVLAVVVIAMVIAALVPERDTVRPHASNLPALEIVSEPDLAPATALAKAEVPRHRRHEYGGRGAQSLTREASAAGSARISDRRISSSDGAIPGDRAR